MPVTGYPNVSITSTNTTLLGGHTGLVLVSTYGSSVNVIITSVIPAGFECWIAQQGGGKVFLTAGSGATVNNVNSYTCTNGAYSLIKLIAISNGNVYFTGDGATT